jgi:hypothetical protein
MTREQAIRIAADNNLGPVYFESKLALNTGRPMEVGYVGRLLFCKTCSGPEGFYLCNEFRRLDGTDV